MTLVATETKKMQNTHHLMNLGWKANEASLNKSQTKLVPLRVYQSFGEHAVDRISDCSIQCYATRTNGSDD